MIEVDISNIWGEVSLPDLLAVEKEIFDAHMKLTEGSGEGSDYLGWLDLPQEAETDEIRRIRSAAKRIRESSDVLVVVGIGGSYLGPRAAIELLQGCNRNLGKGKGDPMILYGGNTLSDRACGELLKLLEGKDFSLCLISKSGTTLEPAIATRTLRFALERKYGTQEARKRIYAITDPVKGALRQLAQEEGWESFVIPQNVGGRYSVLTAVGLLPMAVAGIDPMEVLTGAAKAKKEYDLRSFENPLWLYVAVRRLMGRCGKRTEYLVSWEPGFRCLGQWWQQLFLDCGDGPVPAALEFPGARAAAQGSHFFETVIRFAPDDHPHIIGYDVCDLDGLNEFADLTLDALEERDYLDTLEAHADKGIPFITLECGGLDAETAGQLVAFLELARSVSCAGSEGAGEEAD